MALTLPTALPMAMSSSACDNHAWDLGSLLLLFIGGIIIGALGKFVAPGSRDNIPIWATIICGIVGVLIGYGIWGDTKGIDWTAFFLSIVISAILVMITASVLGRRKA